MSDNDHHDNNNDNNNNNNNNNSDIINSLFQTGDFSAKPPDVISC